jgi:hypothetical protein
VYIVLLLLAVYIVLLLLAVYIVLLLLAVYIVLLLLAVYIVLFGLPKHSRNKIAMKMELGNISGSSLIVQGARPNQAVHSLGLDKSGSFNTATTIEETSLCDDFASPGKAKYPITNFVSNESVVTPSKKKSLMTMSATNKNHKAPDLNPSNDDSFKESEDSSWWQSPKVPTDGGVAERETKESSQSDRLPKSSVEDDNGSALEKTRTNKKPSEKKKKVKRISMIKVKACDVGGLSAHQFTKTGDFATDQKELQKALMQWKAEQKSNAVGSAPIVLNDGSVENRKRSKSKLRGAKEEVEKSDEARHQRSRSTGRRNSETEVVDLTSEDKRSKSVSRRSSDTQSSEKHRSRSVVRKESAIDVDRQKPDEKSEIRSRGRSVGAKRTSAESEEKSRGKSLVRTQSGKITRERSRSVARQRPCEEVEDDEKERNNRDHSVGRPRSSDLELGLKKVDRDTRSRSVARQRPNDEDINSHSTSARSIHSARSKSTAKSEKSNESALSDQSGSIDSAEKKRSKSLIRKSRNLEESYLAPSHGRSGGDEPISSEDEKTRRKRSSSVGAGLTRASSSLSANEKAEKNDTVPTNPDSRKGPHPSPSKSIPWNEFLMHAQSTTCS